MTSVAKINVLYVDDEPLLLDLTKTYLEQGGDINVVTCDDSRKALLSALSTEYDVMVSDYQMPEMDGIELLKKVKEDRSDLPFIIFTGRGREEVAINALNNGADFYLQKGGDPRSQFAELANVIKVLHTRRTSQDRLAHSEDRYRAFISASRTGAWEYDDRNDRLWCSPEYFHMLDWDTDSFPGGYASLDAWVELIHPDDREKSLKRFQDYLRSGLPGMYEAQFRMRHALKGYIWVWSRGQTLYDHHGRNTHITVGTHIDIDSLKRLEQALLREKDRFRDLADNGRTLIWSSDTSGACDYFNKPWLDFTGRTMEQEYGDGWTSGVHPDDYQQCMEIYQNAFARRERFSMVYRLRRHDGIYRWIQDDGTPRFQEDGEFLGYIGHCFDVDDMRRMEDSLLRTNKKLSLLGSVTRHDILNQLTILRGYLEMTRDAEEPATRAKFMHRCEEAAATIQHQIEFTRHYEELGVKRPEWQDIGEILDGIPHSAIPLWHDLHGLEIYADPMLSRVFHNLVDNTFRHAPEATFMRVSASYEEDGSLSLVYEDDGPGILTEEKEDIFQKGFGKNTGLGLFLIREILSMTGIEIVENGVPGEGARFSMSVPDDRHRSKLSES